MLRGVPGRQPDAARRPRAAAGCCAASPGGSRMLRGAPGGSRMLRGAPGERFMKIYSSVSRERNRMLPIAFTDLYERRRGA